jgi:hypothetical protein
MQSIPRNTEQLQGNNVNLTAITPIADITASKEGVHAFVPTRDELAQLAKHWAGEAISDEFEIFWGQCCGGSDWQQINNYWGRVDEIGKILGKEETEKAIGEAYEDEAQRFADASDWIVFRYGTSEEARAYEDGGGQCFLDFEPGVAEAITSKVIERVFRDGSPSDQEALLKEELRRCASKLKANYPHHIIEIFGIHFPSALKPLVLGAGVADPDPGRDTNTFFKDLTIKEGKAILDALKESVRESANTSSASVKGEEARNESRKAAPAAAVILSMKPRPK